MSGRDFKLALVQMAIFPGQTSRNMAHALELVRAAAGNGAQVVLLPEALPFGWMDPSAKEEASAVPDGTHCLQLREAAKELSVFICAGLVERAGDHLFNSAVLINDRGEVLLHHRKINELEIARTLYALGDRLGVAETPFGRIGLMICADAFAPGQVISRTLALMGAQVILSPCAWAVPPDHDNTRTPYGQLWIDNYGPVAREFHIWMAGCSNVGPIQSGPWAGHFCIGCSMVMGPDGTPRVRARYGVQAEEILYLDIPAIPGHSPSLRG
jgi:predicted amidohydrolase